MEDRNGTSPKAAETETGPWPRVWWWVRLVAVLGMVVGLVVWAKPARLTESLASAHMGWVAAAMPLAVAAVGLDALRLFLLMTPVGFREGLWSVVRTSYVVNFVSLFLPGTIGGGAVAWYRLSSGDNLRAQSFVALALNSFMKLLAVCALGAAGLAFDAQASGEYRAWVLPLVIAAALLVAAFPVMLWTRLATRLKELHVAWLGGVMPERVHAAARKMLESLEAYPAAKGRVLTALAVGFVRCALGGVTVLFCLYAVGVEVPYARALWIICVVEASGMLPITMAGIGLPQVAYVGLLALSGVAAAQGLASHVVGWVALVPVHLLGAGIMLRESLAARRGRDA